MKEYLIRAGIIDANSGGNGTFVEQGKDGILGSRDHRRNERVGPQRIQSGPIGPEWLRMVQSGQNDAL